jgi:hypothetical protein
VSYGTTRYRVERPRRIRRSLLWPIRERPKCPRPSGRARRYWLALSHTGHMHPWWPFPKPHRFLVHRNPRDRRVVTPQGKALSDRVIPEHQLWVSLLRRYLPLGDPCRTQTVP